MKSAKNAARHMVYKMGRFGKFLRLFRIPGMPKYETDRQGYRRRLPEMRRRARSSSAAARRDASSTAATDIRNAITSPGINRRPSLVRNAAA